jgi:hypothetical protein
MRSRCDQAPRHMMPLRAVIVAALAVSAMLAAIPAAAQDVAPGVDLFSTPLGTSYQDFSGLPIPNNFFGPGSDPFIGRIDFIGSPIGGPLGPTDTVIRRNAPALLPGCGSSAPVPIEIIALNLVSVNPITVTYNGGLTPQAWNVAVVLSSVPQDPGTMTVNKTHLEGGTFSSTLPVKPKLIFTQVGFPLNVRTLDTGLPIQFSTAVTNGHWTYSSLGTGFFIATSPGGILYDNDRNPITPMITIGPSSNFVAGFRAVGATCETPSHGHGKTMTEEMALLAAHGVIPPQYQQPSPDGQEGATCLPDGSCIITTPTQANGLGGNYHGAGTLCLGDLNNDGRDEYCNVIPGAGPWSMAGLVLALIGAGLWFVTRRRAAVDPMA